MTLAIYGAGGLGKEIADLASRNNNGRWEKIIFVDDIEYYQEIINGYKVISYNSLVADYKKASISFIIAQGEPSNRELLYNKVKAAGYSIDTIIDETAIISDSTDIGEGTIVCENVTIHSNSLIGCNCLIQPMAVIGHDTHIGNSVVISAFCAPGGACTFGDRSYVGMHATLLQNLYIGKDAVVGMGAVVYRDVSDGTTVIGNPARVTRGNEEHKVFN